MIALDLYKAQQKVSKLEAELDKASSSEMEAINNKLRDARQEVKIMRKILDGEKIPSPYRTRPSTFNKR